MVYEWEGFESIHWALNNDTKAKNAKKEMYS